MCKKVAFDRRPTLSYLSKWHFPRQAVNVSIPPVQWSQSLKWLWLNLNFVNFYDMVGIGLIFYLFYPFRTLQANLRIGVQNVFLPWRPFCMKRWAPQSLTTSLTSPPRTCWRLHNFFYINRATEIQIRTMSKGTVSRDEYFFKGQISTVLYV